jgi:putative transposase
MEEYDWLNKVSNNVTKQGAKDVCNTYKRFLKGFANFPKFKSRKHTAPSFYQDCVKIQFTDTHVKIEDLQHLKRRRNKN